MGDYKGLIDSLREEAACTCFDYCTERCEEIADAIEQLVKERDAYNRKAINAISDLRLAIKNGILTPCFYCKHGFPNWNEGCRQEPINGICGNWEWRGG